MVIKFKGFAFCWVSGIHVKCLLNKTFETSERVLKVEKEEDFVI